MQRGGWTAFHGARRVGREEGAEILATEQWRDGQAGDPSLLVFDDLTGRVLDVDLSRPADEIFALLDRAAAPESDEQGASSQTKGVGRPKLGVVAREITLLPRHWEWLASRPGGASITIRKLVDEARRATTDTDRVKTAQEAAYRVMHALAGDRPGYEEALRALYARDAARFDRMIEFWPADVSAYVLEIAAPVFVQAADAA
ncbi:DUF2239 family protein [Terrarubrum flagellatum]|uniref:DUF2239 family protein n=1 Tax=Terrirubrum flagellatum TaxID=2895980 RepID=UPI0031456E12